MALISPNIPTRWQDCACRLPRVIPAISKIVFITAHSPPGGSVGFNPLHKVDDPPRWDRKTALGDLLYPPLLTWRPFHIVFCARSKLWTPFFKSDKYSPALGACSALASTPSASVSAPKPISREPVSKPWYLWGFGHIKIFPQQFLGWSWVLRSNFAALSWSWHA